MELGTIIQYPRMLGGSDPLDYKPRITNLTN